MKALTQIKSTAAAPFKGLWQRFAKIDEARQTQNAIGSHVTVDLKGEADAAVQAFYSNPSVEAFDRYVEGKGRYEVALRCWTDVASSISVSTVESLTQGDDAREDLATALEFYAKEINSQIQQFEADARALADRAGLDYTEPPAITTLRAEYRKARDGVDACRDLANDAGMVWRTFSPMVRPIQRTAK